MALDPRTAERLDLLLNTSPDPYSDCLAVVGQVLTKVLQSEKLRGSMSDHELEHLLAIASFTNSLTNYPVVEVSDDLINE